MGEYTAELRPIFPGVNQASWEVDRKFEDSYSRVLESKADLDGFAAGLDTYLEGLHLELGEDYQENFNVDLPASFEITGTFPEFSYGSWDVSESPTAPELTGLLDLGTLSLESYPRNTVSDPGFDLPVKPTPSAIAEPGDAPEISQIELPATPEFLLPDDPSISTIEIDDAPTVEVPLFVATAPDDDLSRMSTPDFDYVEQVYSSDVWAPLAAKINDGITNGGTGLSSAVEQLIFDSGRYRQDVEGERRKEEARKRHVGKGFDLPQGAAIAHMRNVEADIARDKTELNSKITIGQAELAQKNTHFMLERGVDLEKITVGFFDAQSNRALEAVKASSEIVVKAGELLISRYNGRAQVYNIRAQAYEQELKAAFADLEAFKITMEGKKVASDVQKNVVAVYSAQVAALESRAKLFTSQIEGSKAAAEIERLKMENYEISVKAFTARHEARKAEYQAYATETEAERTKVQAFSERIKAFLAELEAVKMTNEGRIAELNATIAHNSSRAEIHKAEVIGFDSKIKEISAQHDVAIRQFDVNTTRLKAQAGVIESQNKLLMQGVDSDIKGQQLKLDSETAKIDAIKNGYVSLMDLEGKSRLGIFNATAQLMSSAMTSVNASATVSDGLSRGYSASQGITNSLSEQHSYNVTA